MKTQSELRSHIQLSDSQNNGIARLRIKRPDLRNALHSEMWQEIQSKIESLYPSDVRVLVIEGEQGVFTAGADLNEIKTIGHDRNLATKIWTSIYAALDAVYASPFVTIASISGPCLGGGLLLAAACDLRFADDTARFSLPVAVKGIGLDSAILSRVAEVIGVAALKHLIYCGDTIDHHKASSIGLLNECWAASELETMTMQKALAIASNNIDVILATKRALHQDRCQSKNEDQSQIIESYLRLG